MDKNTISEMISVMGDLDKWTINLFRNGNHQGELSVKYHKGIFDIHYQVYNTVQFTQTCLNPQSATYVVYNETKRWDTL